MYSARIMGRALGHLLLAKGPNEGEENEGVLVFMDDEKYIVYTDGSQIKINNATDLMPDEAPEGVKLWVHNGEEDGE